MKIRRRPRLGSASRSRSRSFAGLRGPVGGPTRLGLYRAANPAGVADEVIAPGKMPQDPSDRVKTDRKDAGTLGSSTSVVVPPVEVEAARLRHPPFRCVGVRLLVA